MHKNLTRVLFLGLALLLTMGATSLAFAQDPAPTKTVLVMGTKIDPTLEKRFVKDGIALVSRAWSTPISLEAMKLFDAVIAPDYGGINTPFFALSNSLNDYYATSRNLEVLHQYIEAGGSAFISISLAGTAGADGCESMLAPWGARVRAVQIRDDEHSGVKGQYSWTTNIPDSPLTAEVHRIWYPTNCLRWDDMYATSALVLDDKAWQPIVSGMLNSVAAMRVQDAWVPVPNEGAPVMAASRQIGKGRVTVTTISPFCTLLMPYAAGGWVGEANIGPIEGIFMEKGEGELNSDGYRLLLNTLNWLIAETKGAGLGGYTNARFTAQTAAPPVVIPSWTTAWQEGNAKTWKVLIGARSAFSNGKGTIAEYAAAARAEGYSILVMTETFEYLDPLVWANFITACQQASNDELIVVPGLDIADPNQNRFLLIGLRSYPAESLLTTDKKALKQTQFLSLGFGAHLTVIARPSTTPMPQQLYKFASALAVYTYRNGKLVDNGLLPYQWQVNNRSMMFPLATHEIYAPAEVKAAAAAGHQVFTTADTARNAAWYLLIGEQHFWENPAHVYISSGPVITELQSSTGNAHLLTWASDGNQSGASVRIKAQSDVPITDISIIGDHYPIRKWNPNSRNVEQTIFLPHANLRYYYIRVQDALGRTAITPTMVYGIAARYTIRCSDRQNFFGFVWQYTGTDIPDVDLQVPVPDVQEGRGLLPQYHGPDRGDNMASLLDFPYASQVVHVMDSDLDQRYWYALKEDLIYDGKPSQVTTRSRVYAGRVRYSDFGVSEEYREKDQRRPMIIKEVTVRLRMPVTLAEDIFPSFTRIDPKPEYGYTQTDGKVIKGTLEKSYIDLPVGGYAGDMLALSPGIRVGADGTVGFTPGAVKGSLLPKETSWYGRFVKVPAKEKMQEMRTNMGFGVDGTPYQLQIKKGTLDGVAYVASFTAEHFGIAGELKAAAAMPYQLPLAIKGINMNWDAALWRADGAMFPFGVFEGNGWSRLDATKGGIFYAGNIIMADNAQLRLSIINWEKDKISIEMNNPTDAEITALIETPVEITNKFHLREQCVIPAGQIVRFAFPK